LPSEPEPRRLFIKKVLYEQLDASLVVAAGLLAPKAKGPQSVLSEQSKKSKKQYLSQAELDLLFKAAKKTRYALRDHLGVLLSYRHGLRASELVALEWDQFDPVFY
jgi:integrase